MNHAVTSAGSGTSPSLPSPEDNPPLAWVASDPATALLALMLESRGASATVARQDVNHAKQLLDDARRELREAMQRAAEAQDDAGFWDCLSSVFSGDIAAIAEVVAAAAMVAATGGVGALGVLALVGAGLSLGADVGQRLGLDPKLCAALGAIGGIAGFLSGNASSLTGVWADVATGARVAHVATFGAAGATHSVAEQRRADAVDAEADGARARGSEDDANFLFDQALDTLKRLARDIERGQASASNIARTRDDGRLALVAGVGAA